jgi:hypothetical protein
VSCLARLNKPSSMFSVVLICISMHNQCILVKPLWPEGPGPL